MYVYYIYIYIYLYLYLYMYMYMYLYMYMYMQHYATICQLTSSQSHSPSCIRCHCIQGADIIFAATTGIQSH